MSSYWERKYESAKSAKKRSEQRESSYVSARNRARDDLAASKDEKINLEKRLKGIEKIIRLLTEPGNMFSNNVPDKTQKATKTSEDAGQDYRGCIQCSGIQSADFGDKFRTASVEANSHSAQALDAVRREKVRLEQAIAEVNRQINMLESKISEYKSLISRCNNDQADYRAIMRRCLANM